MPAADNRLLGLPIRDQASRILKCGCVRTVTTYDNGFRVTEIDVKDGCQTHDEFAPKRRAGMSNSRRFAVLKRDAFTCQYCGRRPPDVELEVDHVIAVVNGGNSELANLITACNECNRGKRDR